MTGYGTSSHIVICQATSGSGDSITYDNTSNYTFIKAKEVEFGIDFDSKISNNSYHKSRLSPELKFKQWFNVNDAVLVGGADVNGTTEWITACYIAKTQIYAIIEMPPASGSTYVKKSWYNSSNAKIYYLKGVLGKLKIKETPGRLLKITCDFKEAFLP